MTKNISLSGLLEFLNLGEILQILGNNNSTGSLRLMSKFTQNTGVIYVHNGNPVDAKNDTLTGLDALFSLFGWVEGEFEFKEESVDKKNVINKNRMEIILDGTRLVDDGKIEKLGPVSFKRAKAPGKNKERVVPVIKGPFIDYSYVVDEEEFFEGDDIVIEGNYGSWMWVILEGVIEISKEIPNGIVDILRISEGAFVGSVASFFSDSTVRSATAKALSHVQLGMLDSQRLSAEYAAMSTEMRNIIKCLDNRMKQVTENTVNIYLKKADIKNFTKGKKAVIEQGKNEERLFVINHGQAALIRNTEQGDIPLLELEPGDFFGNIPFLNMGHEPHSASVFASTDMKIAPMNPRDLEREYSKLSPAFKSIIENLTTYISVTTLIACEFHNKNKTLGKKK